MAGNSPRVFLDSNVVYSGLHSPGGSPGEILRMHIEGEIEAVVSQQVLEEVVRNVRKTLPSALPALRQLLLSAPPEVYRNATPEEINRWSGILGGDDAPILAAAIGAQPDFMVTGDRHFFRDPGVLRRCGLDILKPAEFLERLRSADA